MKTRCVIVDDEPLAINVIKEYIQQITDLEILNTFSNAIDTLEYLKTHTVDLIFLDINMPLLDGLSFIESLEIKPQIIITTAHTEFALKTYELDVLDYLVKPIPFPRFLKAINRFKNSNKTNHQSYLKTVSKRPYTFVKINKKKLQKIYFDEILVVESLKDYLKINTTTNRYIIHQTLSSFTEQLPSENFIRIHRSYTIAKDKIDAIEGNTVEIDGIKYIIGRSYVDKVKDLLI